MLVSDPYHVAETFEHLLTSRTAETARTGLNYLRTLFVIPTSPGVTMAISALTGVKDSAEIEQIAPAYVGVMPEFGARSSSIG
jgi:hypothetical protein